MITYRASLDVPQQTLVCVSRWLAAHRKTHDARPWQRASTPFVQAILVLRWFKDATDIRGPGPGREGQHHHRVPLRARGDRRNRPTSARTARRPGPRPGRGMGLRMPGRHARPDGAMCDKVRGRARPVVLGKTTTDTAATCKC